MITELVRLADDPAALNLALRGHHEIREAGYTDVLVLTGQERALVSRGPDMGNIDRPHAVLLWEEDDDQPVFCTKMVYILFSFRSKGLHGFLRAHLEDIARKEGIRTIWSTVHINNIRANAAMVKAGYRHEYNWYAREVTGYGG